MKVERRLSHARVALRALVAGASSLFCGRTKWSLLAIFCAFAFCSAYGRAVADGARGFYVERGRAPVMAEWRVFLVATNIYPDTVGSLKYAEKDVDDLFTHFLEIGVPLSNITVLKSSLDAKNAEFGTSRVAILNAYANYLSSLDENSIAFVYFSGHGYCERTEDGAVRSYYAAQRFNFGKNEDDNRILLDDILARLSSSRARFKWMCVDACRELAPKNSRGLFEGDLNIENVPRGLWLTQSCHAGQRAFEGGKESNGEEIENGLFTRALLAAISGELAADEDQDGTVTLGELQRFVETRVASDAARLFHERQNPSFTAIDEDPAQIKDIPVFPDLPINGYPGDAWRRGRGLAREADALRDSGDYDSALAKIDEALALLKDADAIIRRKIALERLRAPGDCGERFYGLAVAAFETGNYKFAVALSAAAVEESPTNADYLKLLRDATRKDAEFEQTKSKIERTQDAEERVDAGESAYREAKHNFERGLSARLSEDASARYEVASSEIAEALLNDPGNAEYRLLSELIQYKRSFGVLAKVPREHAAGESKTVEIAGIPTVFRWAPPGVFTTMRPSSRDYSEGERREIKLTRGFWLAETETTQRLWKAIMGENPSRYQGDDLPVESILWGECREFIRRLNEGGYAPKGAVFSLPTEAQWERACCAGTTTPFWWGDAVEDGEGCVNGYDLNATGGANDDPFLFPFDDGYATTAPVGSFRSNPWGFKDMLGNVEEMCLDRFGSEWQRDLTDVDPFNYEVNGYYISQRGGSWFTNWGACTSGHRSFQECDARRDWTGFRLLLTDEDAPDSVYAVPPEAPRTLDSGRPYGEVLPTRARAEEDDANDQAREERLKSSKILFQEGTTNFIRGLDVKPEDQILRFKVARADLQDAVSKEPENDYYRLVLEMIESKLAERGVNVGGVASTSTVDYRVGVSKTFAIGGVPTVFRWIPPGKTRFGRAGEATISRGYWLAETETTQALWQSIMGENPSENRGFDLPVESITWLECQEFIRRLNAASYAPSGAVFALPTEAQWERARLAGLSADDFENEESDVDDVGIPAPVRSYGANALGLFDMLENVGELCLDRLDGDDRTPASLVDPLVYDAKGAYVVVLGGAADSRKLVKADERSGAGFRLLLTDERAPESTFALPDDLYRREIEAPSQIERKPGATFTVTLAGIPTVFRWIPPGSFSMGSPENEPGRDPDERLHNVTITRGFWLAETETTQGLWSAVMRYNPSITAGDDYPVGRLSWNDAQAFLRALNERGYAPPGCRFSLPSEAQWELACRVGRRYAFWWGASADDARGRANWLETNGCKATPVGSYAANALGLRDIVGNVWEWCQDVYKEDYGRDAVVDPLGAGASLFRVGRGGSWNNPIEFLRSASRYWESADWKGDDFGVRLLMTDAESTRDLTEYCAPETWRFPERSVVERDLPSGDGVPVAERAPGAWKIVKIAGVPTKFHWVPAGAYQLGYPDSPREIQFSRGFWLAETETTQELWKSVMGDNPSWNKGDRLPVDSVSWQTVQEFVSRVNEAGYAPQGAVFSLPTCAQWEAACRACARTAFWWGDELQDGYGKINMHDWSRLRLNPFETWKPTPFDDGYPFSSPVDSHEANAWGFRDMTGNVWEFSLDFGAELKDKEIDPFGVDPNGLHSQLGGSWHEEALFLSPSDRRPVSEVDCAPEYGFRLLLTEPEDGASK